MTDTPQQCLDLAASLNRIGSFMQRTTPLLGSGDGQCNEVEKIRPLLPGNLQDATYVDVGAADPVECSNTYAFYEEGWRGLLVEPVPTFWYNLLRCRPRDHLMPIAASNCTGVGRLRLCGPCSSLRPDWDIATHAECLVHVDTLANILADHADIRDRCQLCSIDVEGHERQVLEGIDWATFHPAVFVIEYRRFAENDPGNAEDLSGEWEPLLQQQGYTRAAETPMNYIYKAQ